MKVLSVFVCVRLLAIASVFGLVVVSPVGAEEDPPTPYKGRFFTFNGES